MTTVPARALRAVIALFVGAVIAACGGGHEEQAPDGPERTTTVAATGDTWQTVAVEGRSFTLASASVVRYGAGSSWVQRTLSGTVTCSNATFGSDPAFGVQKSCQVQTGTGEPPPASAWTRIASEGQSFTVSGTRWVRYGAGTRWVQRSVTGSGQCTNAFFGTDPAPYVGKVCEVQQTSSNQAPVATIAAPVAGATFRAGTTVSFSGSATDAEDGALAGARLTWWADLHHDTHSHPFLQPTTGSGGTVTIPTRGETSDNIFYRFHLRATDSAGATHEVTRDIVPQKARLTITTVPAGLSLTLDGQPISAPVTLTGVVGIERDLGAPATQDANGRRYQFTSWSDGGAATHTISTPASDTTYTATYTDLGPVANTPPSVALTAPVPNSSGTTGVAIALAATASDSDGSVTGVEFFENGVKIGATDVSAPYGVSWTPATTGARTLTARATDNNGAVTTSASVTVTISPPGNDTQPPVATLTSPANLASGLTGTLTLSANATDNTGVASVEFQVDGQPAGAPDTSPPYSASVDTNLYASGQHQLRARARDAAGNLSAWSTVTVQFGGSRTQPSGFTRADNWVTGLASATAFTQAPDGRLFVALQGGDLRIVRNGALLPTPFVRLSVDSSGERGLIGVALHPNFASNGFVYVYYTRVNGSARNNRISRFTANGDVAVGGETVLVDLPNLSSATNHNGGAMHFGRDGKLYVAVGDNADSSQSPNLNLVFGKMLRFNEDGSIPSDNPFCTTAGTLRCAIWARGLRNPFTFAVRASDGRMHINDVGAGLWEEINLGAPGADYGWPATEGPTNAAGVTSPLFAYDHDGGSASGMGGFFNGCAITGGAFYPSTGNFLAAYRESYFFTDFCSSVVGRVDLANGNAAYAFGRVSGAPVGMLVGLDGALYVLTQGGINRFAAP
ncbi:PQQ-dependent sugar dehydrogenase [Piscinibacter gummiphilus]|uniref:PQQ-dependent sugar dehydrogenase n=1 Tax=Piscinibacter gummiphilus TaxID=946333 RepID=A0ABZ0CSA1_9BURK|nr:PQQ-dependent sugar dehydrogenase [Piscinibacter gummiphilus]WOB07861.1 PQQ-dependent sugar dehydrogenase [Piscinibacter gummiphilus]